MRRGGRGGGGRLGVSMHSASSHLAASFSQSGSAVEERDESEMCKADFQ